MGQLVLLVVAAAWAAVLVPPLLRSRIENRPNSSVSDFRDQLSSLQRAMPARGVAMRSMARPLAQSPLSRPAAAGRPGGRVGRTHSGSLATARANGKGPGVRRRARSRPAAYDAAPRVRSHADGGPGSGCRAATRSKRRRANVLFVLALTAGCTLFLAATTQAQAMVWVAVVTIVALLGYVCLLGQLRQRDLQRELAGQPPGRAGAAGRRRSTRLLPSSGRRRAMSAGRRRRAGATGTPGRFAARARPVGAVPTGRPPSDPLPVHSRPPRGCSSVGRAQQSHC